MRCLHTLCTAIAGPLAFAACSAGSPCAGGRDAVLVEPTPETKAELRQWVSVALNGVPVLLADSALTQSPTLSIERAPARDTLGRPLTGRELDQPEIFRLLRSGRQCLLVHERSGRRFALATSACAPL